MIDNKGKLFILLSCLLSRGFGAVVCDNVGPNCNVVDYENFVNSNFNMFDYPNEGPTIVGGVTYDAVISWDPEPNHALVHTFEVYRRSQEMIDCSNVKLWNNGEIADADQLVRSNPNKHYCRYDLNGAFSRENLLNTDDVYFLLDGIVQS